MNYVIEYDIAAIFLSLSVMVGFLHKKMLFTSLSRIFTNIQALIIVSAAFDIATILLMKNPEVVPLWVHYVVNICYHCPYQLMAPVFYKCIKTASAMDSVYVKENQISKFLIWVPCIVTQILIFTTPITHAFFYFDENLNYCHGIPWFYAGYVSSGFYMILAIITSYRARNCFSLMQAGTVYLYTICVFISIFIQLFFPKLLIVSFVSSVGIMLIFLSLDDPANYLDKSLMTYNFQAFEKIIQQNILQKGSLYFMALQIKDLDSINESLGRKNTDRFLSIFCKRILEYCTKKSVFRISGSRFVIMLPGDKSKQRYVVSSIRALVIQPFTIDAYTISPIMAMTVFSYPDDAKNLEDINLILENCLVQMPECDLGLVVPVNPMILENKHREYKIYQTLKDAVVNQDFDVFYQPVYSLEDKRFISAEALVRLSGPKGSYITAEEFISAAENNGLILEIGDIVLRKTCKFIKESNITDLGIEYISINLSVIQCMQADFYKTVLKCLELEGVDGRFLNFEVTETATIVAAETLLNNISLLQPTGVSFSMDNYGKDYSNLLEITKFNFRSIKLSRSMISALTDSKNVVNENIKSILVHSIKMINSLNMKVIAEGAESEEHFTLLKEAGCNYIQGYYYSRPLPADDFVSLMKNYKAKK